jgi:hypothetical protein
LFLVFHKTIKQQFNIAEDWMAAKWSSICGKHKKISNPMLVITETDNNTVSTAIL